MAATLRGRRIVVTRAREQAGDLVRALEHQGADVVLAPVIRIEPLPDLTPLRDALGRAADYRWLVFTSQNAVQIVGDRLVEWGMPDALRQAPVAAIGPATADALKERGVTVTLVPSEHVAEGLLTAMVARGGLGGARVLIPSAQDAREVLAAGLRTAGATVEVIPVYRTTRDAGGGRRVQQELLAGKIDAVTFTSSSTVKHFVDIVGREAASSRYVAAVIGPVTAQTARDLGLGAALVEASPYTVPGLVEALCRHFA